MCAVWVGVVSRVASGGAGAVGFPLGVVGEVFGAASAVEGEDRGGDAVDQVAVVGYQDEGAGEIEEGVFEDFERRDVEVVGGLVEDQEVGGLEHQSREDDARFFAAGEFGDATSPAVRGGRGSAWPRRLRGGCGRGRRLGRLRGPGRV